MKISLNWLKTYVEIPASTDELIERLVRIGFNIESVENQSDKYKNFVIGKVLEKRKHPNADKLSLCKVDIGKEIFNVVCGAPNVEAGQTICFAKVGAVIPNGEFELKKAKIRGEISEGMICSAKEMDLGDDHSGIMVLDNNIPIGQPFAEYLGANDIIIDIDITPNRGDLLSHFGVAQEISALFNKKVLIPPFDLKESNEKIDDFISVDILNPEGCFRYCGRLVKNVSIKDSPEWLKKYLTSVGLRPINNVVDVTNFVMLECGQPLHAFDYNLIAGKKIVVKDSKGIKKFTTLDAKVRELNDNILLICDGEKPVALAGIMGGENSEIRETTSSVFIESAYFDPVLTRKSSKFLGLQTDSSFRFERGVNMSAVDWACNRAAQLIAELSDGTIVSGLIDNYPNKLENKIVTLDIEFLNKIAGIDIPVPEIIELLEGINVRLKNQTNNLLEFEIPFARYNDLERDIDLVEEVIRLYGYENIEELKYDKLFLDAKEFDDHEFSFVQDLREFLIGRGFKEILTNNLIDEKIANYFDSNLIKLLNPSSQEMNVLRNNLFIGALEAARNNFNFKSDSLKLFEIGDIFQFNNKIKTLIPAVEERKCLFLLLGGNYDFKAFNEKTRSFDIFDLKGEFKVLLDKLNIDNYKLNYYNYSDFYDFRIDYLNSNEIFASIYAFSKNILNIFDIQKPIFGCEIFLKHLINLSSQEKIYSEISKFPPVLRDLSLVVSKSVQVNQIQDEIRKEGGNLLKEINLYDIYNLSESNKENISYTFSLEYSSSEKTLTDNEINIIQDRIIKNLNKKLKAELRT